MSEGTRYTYRPVHRKKLSTLNTFYGPKNTVIRRAHYSEICFKQNNTS